jgi:hypothetical protein
LEGSIVLIRLPTEAEMRDMHLAEIVVGTEPLTPVLPFGPMSYLEAQELLATANAVLPIAAGKDWIVPAAMRLREMANFGLSTPSPPPMQSHGYAHEPRDTWTDPLEGSYAQKRLRIAQILRRLYEE